MLTMLQEDFDLFQLFDGDAINNCSLVLSVEHATTMVSHINLQNIMMIIKKEQQQKVDMYRHARIKAFFCIA